MIRNKLFGIGLILTLIISVSFIGCSSDDDDETAGSGGGGGGDTAGQGGENGGPYTFTGVVQDLVTDDPVPDMPISALDNNDLSDLGITATSGADGTFTLEGIEAEEFCVKVGKTEDRIDSVTCNVPSDQQGRFVVSTELSVAVGINGLLYPDEDPNPDLPGASGGVYFIDGNGDEVPIDCATVEVENPREGSGMFYFKDGLPNKEATHTDITGRFLSTKLDAGPTTVVAYIDGAEVGRTTLPLLAPSSNGSTFNSNITRIYAEGVTSDPTPDCQ